MSYPDNTPRHRSRLSHADVKLILFLIVQIKPFKYVGDRTLSQSRKWDLIQQKLEQHKLRHGPVSAVVPTVRTLQRQMATALRKAQHRHQPDHYVPFLVFASLSRTSALADLELAVLELYNLSEAYKTGQTVGPLPDLVVLAFEHESVRDFVLDLPDDYHASSGRHNLDVLAQLHRLLPELAAERDDSEIPPLVAPLVAKIRQLGDQNRTFHSEQMAMLRLHAAATHDQLLRLEEWVVALARLNDPVDAVDDVNPDVKSEPDRHDEPPLPEPKKPEFAGPGRKDTMLRSILELLN